MPEPWRDELSAASVVDIGAGDGFQGIRLARRGYEVTLADPSAVDDRLATFETRHRRVEDVEQ